MMLSLMKLVTLMTILSKNFWIIVGTALDQWNLNHILFRDDEKESAADLGMKAEVDETESHIKLCDSQFARAQ